jgi:hypothetical protein
MHERGRRVLTLELGGMVAVDVDDGDEVLDLGPGAGEAVAEVEAQQLLLRRVEPVPRREHRIMITATATATSHPCLQQHDPDRDLTSYKLMIRMVRYYISLAWCNSLQIS